MNRSRTILVPLATLLLAALATATRAAVIEFTVDPAQSVLSIDPSTLLFGAELPTTPQAANSLSTSFSGSIFADVKAMSIQIVAGSSLVAGNSGAWLPGTDYANYPGDLDDPNGYISTPQPANFGLITDLTSLGDVAGKEGLSPSAIRDVGISLLDSAPKELLGTTFNVAGTATDFTSGTVFYSSGGAPPITDLANTVEPGPLQDLIGLGSVIQVGNQLVLTIPVVFDVSYPVNFLTIQTRYSGMIVATALVPEPSSLVLVAAGAGCLLLLGRRSK